MSSTRIFVTAMALTLSMSAREAVAQVDQFALNFEEIKITYATGSSAELPFRTELTLGADGSGHALLRTYKATDVTFKRGTFYPADTLAQTTLEMALDPADSSWIGSGSLLLDSAHPAGGAGGHVKVFNGSTDRRQPTDDIEVFVPRVRRGSVVELRFMPVRGAQLQGQPASAFNRPRAGEALIARLPTPPADTGIKVYVDVVYNHSAQTATVWLRTADAVAASR
jgi:hypothetical protein